MLANKFHSRIQTYIHRDIQEMASLNDKLSKLRGENSKLVKYTHQVELVFQQNQHRLGSYTKNIQDLMIRNQRLA